MSRKFSHALTGAALLALCTAASAQWTVRGGLTHIAPHSSATDAVGPMLPGPPSAGRAVQNASTTRLKGSCVNQS